MSYNTIARIAQDGYLTQRLIAAAAEEHKARPYPQWVQAYAWDLASTPGWAAAWESAVAGGNDNPGQDDAVITDGMILAAVQPMDPALPPTAEQP